MKDKPLLDSVREREAWSRLNRKMNSYYNLPREQRRLQRQVEQYNADAQLWRKLQPKRQARRKLRPRFSKKRLTELALGDFTKERPPVGCIGEWATS